MKHLNSILVLIIFSIVPHISFAQQNVKVFSEETPEGIALYADNFEFCPVTVSINFQLKNIKMEGKESASFLIKDNTTKVLLATFTIIDKYKTSKFGYTYSASLGDNNQMSYDTDFNYYLPFEKGKAFVVHQGYNGKFSHQNENSLDFTMPVGTPITAIRDGIVIRLVENNSKVCPKKECGQYNNYVIVYHPDGTFAEYTHLNKNGVLVNVGEKVSQGQIIASSGNTGFSSGPHLHLMIFRDKTKFRETIPTKFKIDDGTQSQFLKEKETYTRSY